MKCGKCVNEIKDSAAKFCPVCGADTASGGMTAESSGKTTAPGKNKRVIAIAAVIAVEIAALFLTLGKQSNQSNQNEATFIAWEKAQKKLGLTDHVIDWKDSGLKRAMEEQYGENLKLSDVYEKFILELDGIEERKAVLEKRKLVAQNQRECEKCGAILNLDSVFCNKCGERLAEIPSEVLTDEPL